jgi:hypothetical protein
VHLTGVVAIPCAMSAAALGLACGSHGDSGFTLDSNDNPTSDAGGSQDSKSATQSDASVSTGNGEIFESSDAAPTVMFECEPGTYTGMFVTKVTNDAGGLFSLFSFNWSGSLSITLQAMVMNSGAGEIPLPTLIIAPGAKLDGMDMMGGHFSADMTGQLDCPSKTLTITIANGMYTYFGDAGGVSMTGSMSATYDGTMTPPQLTMGEMNVGSPQISGVAAGGTWTATLQ